MSAAEHASIYYLICMDADRNDCAPDQGASARSAVAFSVLSCSCFAYAYASWAGCRPQLRVSLFESFPFFA
jgi:hypothetical protein